MKRIFLLQILFLFYTQVNAKNISIYISVKGGDNNPGTELLPFQTLERAQKETRKLIRKGADDDINIYLRNGTYYLKNTLVFKLEDSFDNHKVIYQAFPGEKATISSGFQIEKWEKLKTGVEGIPNESKDKIWVAQLPKTIKRFNSLFQGEKRLPRARTKGFDTDFIEGYKDYHTLHLPEGAISNWSNMDDAEIAIIPRRLWCYNIVPVSSFNEKKRILNSEVPTTYPMQSPPVRTVKVFDESVWIENIFEALDEPGEWFLDYNKRLLYLYQDPNDAPSDIFIPLLTELIKIEGEIDYDGPVDIPVKGIVFKNLNFIHGDRYTWTKDKAGWGLQHDWEMFDKPTAMLRFRGAENCSVIGCNFTAGNGSAIRLDLHCQNIEISENKIDGIGGVGILLNGYGPGTKDVNRNNKIIDNTITETGKILWHSPAILVWQSGENLISHNTLSHLPYCGIAISGRIYWNRDITKECSNTIRFDELDDSFKNSYIVNESLLNWSKREKYLHGRNNRVEWNDISHYLEKLGDGNAIYVSGTGANNLIQNNYVHDGTSHRINGNIRCDNDQHLTIINQNIISNCCGEGIIFKGRTQITNNVIYNLMSQSPDGEEVHHQRGFWVVPQGEIDGSVIQRNVCYSLLPKQKILFERQKEGRLIPYYEKTFADNNIYFSEVNNIWAKVFLKKWQQKGVEENSLLSNPQFVDPVNGNFNFESSSPALKLGIVPLDLSKAGVRRKIE